jgi:cytidylate kinase
MADIARRDARDSGRAAAPLVQAADAHLLDTSEMTIEHAFREARRLVEQALGR